jgi:hypothetical protein
MNGLIFKVNKLSLPGMGKQLQLPSRKRVLLFPNMTMSSSLVQVYACLPLRVVMLVETTVRFLRLGGYQ